MQLYRILFMVAVLLFCNSMAEPIPPARPIDLQNEHNTPSPCPSPSPSSENTNSNGNPRSSPGNERVSRHRGPNSFCSRSLAHASCPDPRTMNEFRAEHYVGRWYEIGSTALFKFQSELGLVCEHSIHSLLARRHDEYGAVLSFLNRGRPVLTPLEASAVLRLSAASQGVCNAARSACSIISQRSIFDHSISQIRSVVNTVRRNHILRNRHELAALGPAVNRIESLEKRIVRTLERLGREVSRLQELNANISQAVGHPDNNIDALIEESSALNNAVRDTNLRIPEISANVRTEILRNARFLRPENRAMAVDLEQSVSFLELALSQVQVLMTEISFYLSAITSAARAYGSVEPPPVGEVPGLPVSEMRGIAVQNPDSLGKFQVRQFGGIYPYWVVDYERQNSTGRYSSVLIYSCSEENGRGPRVQLRVLSRRMRMDRGVMERFMRTARKYGIYTECDNPFVYSVQHNGTCHSWPY